MSRVATPPYERVMAKVQPEGECLVFTGKTNVHGYGRTSIQVNGRTRELMAHRVVLEHHQGPIPKGLSVLHSCDNPPCVAIAHLRTGTHLDNSKDMVERVRGRKGMGKETCLRGHDLSVHGRARAPRAQNPDYPVTAVLCLECQRIDVRVSRGRRTGKMYTGQPHHRDKTHCKRGHEFNDENTYIKRNGSRQCKVCVREARKVAAS